MRKDALVEQVKGLQRLGQKQVWWDYADTFLGGVRDPNKHDEAVLEEFLISAGAAGVAPLARGKGSPDALVEQVKGLQRSGQKQVWWDYADTFLGGVRDPNKHDEAVLQEFLVSAGAAGVAPLARGKGSPRAGGRLGPPDTVVSYSHPGPGWVYIGDAAAAAGYGSNGPGGVASSAGGTSEEMVSFVKMGQKMSQSFKGAWAHYCQAYGGGRNDPAGYDQAHIAGFIDYLGQLGSADLGAAQQMAPAAAGGWQSHKRSAPGGLPPAKRHSPGTSPAEVGAEKADLIARVKALQKQSPELKAAWWKVCDEHRTQQGVKDPARHDMETLESFLAQYE